MTKEKKRTYKSQLQGEKTMDNEIVQQNEKTVLNTIDTTSLKVAITLLKRLHNIFCNNFIKMDIKKFIQLLTEMKTNDQPDIKSFFSKVYKML